MDLHKRADFERFTEEVLREYHGAGLAIAIIDGERTMYQKFWGHRDVEAGLPVDEQTIFGLASITKSFTCLAIMQLQEAGKLCVADPVEKYLPEFHYPGDGILTIENLMAHNGGYEPQPALGWSIRQHTVIEQQSDEAAKRLAEWNERFPPKRMDNFSDMIMHLSDPAQRLLGRPGEVFSYSNDTYGVLGEIIKRVSGAASYEAYMEEHILKPLGMNRSWYEVERLEGTENVTTLYVVANNERKVFKNWQVAPAFTPCGFLKSTLADMKNYLRMYLHKGTLHEQKLLSPQGVADMIRPCQPCQHQRYYGYGLNIQSVEDIRIVEHGGSLAGVSTHIAWSPEIGMGVVVLCNTDGVPVQKLATAAMMWCNERPIRLPRIEYRSVSWSEELRAGILGEYLSGEGSTYVIKLNDAGKLVITIGSDPIEHEIQPVLPELAIVRIRMNEIELRPLRRENGEIWAVFYGSRTVPRKK